MARHREDKDNVDVIASTLFIYFVSYFAFVDIGSTHSYVASTISMTLNMPTKCTTIVISVVSLLGQFVRVDKVFKRVPLKVQGIAFSVDLMEHPFEEFDLILGLD